MLKLHMVQAEFGECLIVECGPEDDAKFVLVDGGPNSTYASHLRLRSSRSQEEAGSSISRC